MNADLNYWSEALGEALCEVGKFNALTSDEREEVAKFLSSAHECYGMAFYAPPASDPLQAEIDRLNSILKHERSLIFCRTCQGSGREIGMSGPWHYYMTCSKCNGHGKHKP